MAKKFHQPVRMCVSCRKRDAQEKLIRLQCVNGSLSAYEMGGRSFYLCLECTQQDKNVSKSLMRQCKSKEKEKLMNKLKEIIADGRKS